MPSRTESRIFQYSLKGELVDPKLGQNKEATYFKFRILFGDLMVDEADAAYLHRGAESLAFVFCAGDISGAIERILVAGITESGYVAMPFLVMEKDVQTGGVEFWEVDPRGDLSICDFWYPWQKIIDGERVNEGFLDDIIYFTAGETSSDLSFKKTREKRATELLTRWGLQGSYEVEF